MLLRQATRHAAASASSPATVMEAVLMSHDAADAYEADAVAVGGGRRTRRRQQGVVEAVLEAPKVAGVRRGVLPAVGVARLVAAAELGHGRRRPLLGRQQHDDEQAPGGEPLALHCTTTCFFFCVFPSIISCIANWSECI